MNNDFNDMNENNIDGNNNQINSNYSKQRNLNLGKLLNNNSKVPDALKNLNKNRMNNSNKKSSSSKIPSSKQGGPSKKDDSPNKTSGQNPKSGGSKSGGALNKLSKVASSGALGGKAKKVAQIADKLLKNKKKIKIFVGIMSTIGPALFWGLITLMIVMAIMIPICMIGENIDKIGKNVVAFGDKFTNMVTGQGFTESSNLVAQKLADAKSNYKSYEYECLARKKVFDNGIKDEDEGEFHNRIDSIGGCISGDFDEGILISTLQVNNAIDFDEYDVDKNEGSKNDSTYQDNRSKDITKDTVDVDEVNSMYTYIDSKFLGDYKHQGFLAGENPGLILNLIDYKINWQCKSADNAPLEKANDYVYTMGNIFKNVGTQLFGTSSNEDPIKLLSQLDIGLRYPITSVPGLIDAIKTFQSARSSGIDFSLYLAKNYNFNGESKYKNNSAKLIRMLWNSDGAEGLECKDNESKYPVLVKFINYENYVNYLKDVYVPTRYFDCDSCKKKNWTPEAKEKITKEVINSILDQRNMYYRNRGVNSDLKLKITVDPKTKEKAYSIDGNAAGISVSGGSFVGGSSGNGLKQADPRWGNILLGSSSSSSIGRVGCYLTSITTLILNSGTEIVGNRIDPGTLATVMKNNGAFSSSGSLSGGNWQNSWKSIAPNFKFESSQTCGSTVAACSAQITNLVKAGYFVVVNVPGHFVPVVGVDGGKVIISDPAGYGSSGSKGKPTNELGENYTTIKSLRVFSASDAKKVDKNE